MRASRSLYAGASQATVVAAQGQSDGDIDHHLDNQVTPIVTKKKCASRAPTREVTPINNTADTRSISTTHN